MLRSDARQSVLVIVDGAADWNRERGGSPLAVAHTPTMDRIADRGVCGLVQTLYEDLPRESMIAQMGMLGWSPRQYYPGGRASAELLGAADIRLQSDAIAFRANLVHLCGDVLESYSAHGITSEAARRLIELVKNATAKAFPEFSLYHHEEFRGTVVVRGANVAPPMVVCPEPHENHGRTFDLTRLVMPRDPSAVALAARLNEFVVHASHELRGEQGNALFLWSPSTALDLPCFYRVTGFAGRVGMVGFMNFFAGLAKAGGVDFVRVGNGRVDTDFEAKGRRAVELLERGYHLVVCHINAPDEASHAADLDGKIRTLEQIDAQVLTPVVAYFDRHPEALGGVMVLPDHYSNILPCQAGATRMSIHGLDPVPFALWSRRQRDRCPRFDESSAATGHYGHGRLTHLDLLPLLTAH